MSRNESYNSNKIEPVPWEHFTSGDSFASWDWQTTHFKVTIMAEGVNQRVFNWKIIDLSSGFPKPFEQGASYTFLEASDAALEVVGKSYDRALGYQAFTGDLSAKFIISDGKQYNFKKCIGENVIVTAYDENGNSQLYNGLFDIQYHEFAVIMGEDTILIPPHKVIDVVKEFGMISFIKDPALSGSGSTTNNGRKKRTIQAEWERGCTGKAGFNPGTVQHPPSAPYCSIHDV